RLRALRHRREPHDPGYDRYGPLARRGACIGRRRPSGHALIAPARGRFNATINTPAAAAINAIIRKKAGVLLPLQKLPSQPARKLPAKMVANESPMTIDC